MIEGIVFDKDGTLFDFRVSWGGWAKEFLPSISRNAAHTGQLGQAIGFDLVTGEFAADSPVIASTASEIALRLLPFLPDVSAEDLTDRIDAAATCAVMSETVPLRPLLTGLRARGLRLGVATNDSEAPARAHLAAHGLLDLFDFIAGYDSGHGAKPGPGMCLAFGQAMGLDGSRTVMVGDSRHDLEAGRAAGMHTIAVLTGVATASDLAPYADVVLKDIGAIPAWLDSLPGKQSG